MKIGIDVDGVILDYERVLKTYADLYDFLELNKSGVINRNEHYLRKRYQWSNEERMNFFNKYSLELSKKTPLIPGAEFVIKQLQKENNELIVISARGDLIKGMEDIALEKFKEAGLTFDKCYWKQNDKLNILKHEKIDVMIDDSYDICKKLSENKIKTIYFRDKEMKKIEENEYLKEVSNWGEIYRIIKHPVINEK